MDNLSPWNIPVLLLLLTHLFLNDLETFKAMTIQFLCSYKLRPVEILTETF
jgi:hypothetical protein